MLTRKKQGDSMLFYEGDTLVLTVEETEWRGGIRMKLSGELRSGTAHYIQDELDAFTTVGVKVVMDFGEVTFVAPSVLNAVLDSQQNVDYFRQGEILLTNVSKDMYQDMDGIGLPEVLKFER